MWPFEHILTTQADTKETESEEGNLFVESYSMQRYFIECLRDPYNKWGVCVCLSVRVCVCVYVYV